MGFITNNGCNHKYSGCWKVCGDETYSRRLFAQYKSCKQQLSQALKDTDGNLLHCLCTNSIIQNRACNSWKILQLFIGVGTGNTESMANAIAEGISAAEVPQLLCQ